MDELEMHVKNAFISGYIGRMGPVEHQELAMEAAKVEADKYWKEEYTWNNNS